MSSLSISGLASGLDTDAIVQKMMAVERRPQASLKLQQSQSQVRRDALRDISTRLVNLQSAIRDLPFRYRRTARAGRPDRLSRA